MGKTLCRLMLVSVLLTPYVAARQESAGDTWARYKQGTLGGVIKARPVSSEGSGKGVNLGSDPVRARVIYMGISRPTVAAKRRFISFYMESAGKPEFANKYTTEMLFIENGVKFWLPVQDVLLPYFREELHAKESIILFAEWIGTTYPEKHDKGLHVFLVNEFERPGASKTRLQATKGWVPLDSPDKDFTVEFPVGPKIEERHREYGSGEVETPVRKFYVFTDTLMLSVSFQDLGYTPNSPFSDTLAPTFERKLKDIAGRNGWKIVKIRRLSSSTAEVEAWQRSDTPVGYAHVLSRSIVRNGRVYDLQCRSSLVGQEVDRGICHRFLNSFHIIGAPR
jgi:hypothetical protein